MNAVTSNVSTKETIETKVSNGEYHIIMAKHPIIVKTPDTSEPRVLDTVFEILSTSLVILDIKSP